MPLRRRLQQPLSDASVAHPYSRLLSGACHYCYSPQSPEAIKAGLRTAYLQLDQKLRKLPEIERGDDHSGSTSIGSMVTPDHIVLSNCGDSRAIIVRDGKAILATEDHKPYNPTEQARIRDAGGHVSMQRVNGDLAVSRALGDFVYKQCASKPDVEQQVSPEPEFYVHERSAQDSFLVLACDGIWDVKSNQNVADFVTSMAKAGCTSLDDMAAELIKDCLKRGSRDNMSAIIVRLPGAPVPTEEEKAEWAKRYAAQLKEEAGEADHDTRAAGTSAAGASH